MLSPLPHSKGRGSFPCQPLLPSKLPSALLFLLLPRPLPFSSTSQSQAPTDGLGPGTAWSRKGSALQDQHLGGLGGGAADSWGVGFWLTGFGEEKGS